MKKIVFSLLVMVAVFSVASLGSYALWSDKESSKLNTITADKLDLYISDEANAMRFENMAPGSEGYGTVPLKNISERVNGNLSFSISNLSDTENECVEPEKNEGKDTTCGEGYVDGELSQNMEFRLVIDRDGDGVVESEDGDYDSVTYKKLSDFSGKDVFRLNHGEEVYAQVYYKVSNSDVPFADNIFMTDFLGFTVDFTLTQIVE